MPDQFVSGICAILDSRNNYIGTGFLVSKWTIVTCAHVIKKAGKSIQVKFTGQTTVISAELDTEYWDEAQKVDVAFLLLKEPPLGVNALPLGTARRCEPGDVFQSFGYPKLGDLDGVYALGEMGGLTLENKSEVLQLSSGDLDQGHSGAPVWDVKRKVVVGMVSSVASPGARGKFQDTAIAIPSETIWQVCPKLVPSEKSPYMGLENFTEETSQYYFGRQALTEKLLEVFRGGCRFLAVFGPSGSGKSSVVRAGLMPALKSGRIIDSQKWIQVVIRPADNPYKQMSATGLDLNNIHAFIKSNSNMERIVLFVDQFEELFTLCPDDLRIRFIQDLAAALENSRFILVISMRDDFYSAFNAKAESLAASEYLKIENIPGTLKPSDLVDMIERPAETVGLALEEGLTKLIMKDVAAHGETRSAVLPLLEFALSKLWDRRKDHLLTHEAYQEIGGVTGSLARWADDAYMDLPKENRYLAESLLTSLVHLGDENLGLPDTRRRRTLSELTTTDSARKVIKHFTDHRLIVTSEDTVELIHDAILREWGQFGSWLNENRNFLTWRQRMAERSREWEGDKSDLLRGRELSVAQEFWSKRRLDPDEPKDLDQLERFILLSQQQAFRSRLLFGSVIVTIVIMLAAFGIFAWNQRNSAVSSQSTTVAGMTLQAQSLENEQSALQSAQIEKTRVANAEATALANLNTAGVQETLKISENLSAEAMKIIDTNYIQGLLLGIESYHLLETSGLSTGKYPDTVAAMLNKVPIGLVQTLPFSSAEVIRKVEYAPSGHLLATLGKNVQVWRVDNDGIVTRLPAWHDTNGATPTDFTFSPSSTLLAISYENGQVSIFDIGADGTQILNTWEVFSSPSVLDLKVSISNDGGILAVSGIGTIELFNINDPSAPTGMGHVAHPHEAAAVTYLQFDPNFKEPYLVSGGGDGTFRVWNLRASEFNPSESQRAILKNGGVANLVVSSRYVVVAGSQTIDIYRNFNSGFDLINSFEYSSVHRGIIESMVVNQKSTRLFTAIQDGSIIEWDISDPKKVQAIHIYEGHTNLVDSMAIEPGGSTLLSAGRDSRVILWNVSGNAVLPIWNTRESSSVPITDISFAIESNLLALGNSEGVVELFDVSTPTEIRMNNAFTIESPVERIAFTPDQKRILFMGGNNNPYRPTAYLYNIEENVSRHIFETNTSDIFVPGNNYLLAGEVGDGTLKIFRWDISGDTITRDSRPLSAGACPFVDEVFSLQQNRAIIAGCTLQLWDFPTDNNPALRSEMEFSYPADVALNFDGSLLASINSANSISIWELQPNGEYASVAIIESPHLYGVTSIALNPDGTMMATGGGDMAIIIWDILDSSHPVQRVALPGGHTSAVMNGSLFLTADGRTLISASENEVLLWDMDTSSWIEKACQLAGRNLTELEWQQYVGPTITYHETCPNIPIQ